MARREYKVRITEIKQIYIDNYAYRGRKLDGGYVGENDATSLSFDFGSEFEGYTPTVHITSDGTKHEAIQGDLTFRYDLPSEYMTRGVKRLYVALTSGEQTVITPSIYLEVK